MGLAKIASQNDSDQIAKGSKDHIELPPSPRSHQSAKNTPSSSQQGRLIRQHPGIDSLDFGTHFDEDDEELIEIAKRIEENFTKHQKPPPISRHSHSEPHEMYRDVENGYFDEFIGGEDEELINELAKTIDQSNKSKKFPPPRDWKLNMREVQENEDYGGALLTEDERTLLGLFSTKSLPPNKKALSSNTHQPP